MDCSLISRGMSRQIPMTGLPMTGSAKLAAGCDFHIPRSGVFARNRSFGVAGSPAHLRLKSLACSSSRGRGFFGDSGLKLQTFKEGHRCGKGTASMHPGENYSGSILAELDRAAAKKQQKLAAAGEAGGRCHVEESPAADHPAWNALQRILLCVLASLIACTVLPRAGHAAVAENSIGASKLGIKVAEFLRGSGLSDELVVLIIAMLPVLELRGAIPVSYWLQLEPLKGCILAVIGNMIPVPFIVLYLEKVSKYVGEKSEAGQKFVNWVFERTRKKAGPIEEFQWLGLMLFVAVPLPGTGAWTGAIAASILGMPFWDAMTANFLGVVLAGLLVNLFVTVGANVAVLVGIAIMGSSFFMWSILRVIQQKRST